MIRVRAMTGQDLALGMRLKRQAGWNQTEADWLRLLELQPDGCFVAELDRIPAATLASCRFGSVAWLAMLLVDPPARGRGLAKALLEHALAHLDSQDVPTVRLDATPLGWPLYERFGFVGEYRLTRYDGVLQDAGPAVDVQSFRAEWLPQLVELDRRGTGADRSKLVAHWAREDPEAIRVALGDAGPAGYLMVRPGTEAHQLGPCVVEPGSDAAQRLWADACGRYAGRRVFADVPSGHAEAAALARAAGLAEGRPFLRMRRGEPIAEDASGLWASSGPELG
jgi:ribosomal protein S18 acetylase RimI-like enzyme